MTTDDKTISKRNSLFDRVAGLLGSIAKVIGTIVFGAALILAYNAASWLQDGNPRIPQLEGRWWGGSYNTKLFGQQWCVARFIRSQQGKLQMVLLSPWGKPNFFDVERDSSSETFISLTLTDSTTNPPLEIDARQLYAGARYYVGPLFAGRFDNIGRMNEDVSIRGMIDSTKSLEFGIEPITDDRLVLFWKNYVRPDQPLPSPSDLLKAAGVTASADPRVMMIVAVRIPLPVPQP